MFLRYRGRAADYSTPPAQIPACSFPAPGFSVVLAPQSSLSPTFGWLCLGSFSYVWSFYLEAVKELLEAIPIEAVALTAAIEPFEQYCHRLLEKSVQAFVVAVDAIVIVITSQLGVQLTEQVFQCEMPVLPAPFRKVLDGFSQLLGCSAAFEMRLARSIFAPPKLKTQKVEAGF